MAEDNQDAKKKAAAPRGTKKAAPKKPAAGQKTARKTVKQPAAAKKAGPKAGVKAAPKAGAKKSAPEPARTKAAPAKKAPVKKAPPAKQEKRGQKPAGRTVTVTLTGSPIGRKACQRATLVGLGLNKMHKTRTLQDTPEVRGMINKVKHLVKVEDAA